MATLKGSARRLQQFLDWCSTVGHQPITLPNLASPALDRPAVGTLVDAQRAELRVEAATFEALLLSFLGKLYFGEAGDARREAVHRYVLLPTAAGGVVAGGFCRAW